MFFRYDVFCKIVLIFTHWKNRPQFYDENQEVFEQYRVFKLIKDYSIHTWDESKMREEDYPGVPHGKYALLSIDEEISINPIDLNVLLSKQRIERNVEYSPIFTTGKELKEFLKR